jgi:glycosyltransferase involved in cell wall biosynthesis
MSSPIPILCFSTTDWDEIYGSRQQLMSRLAAAGHVVLFIERQVGPEHLLRDPWLRRRKLESWKNARLRLRRENLWLLQPDLALPGRYYSPLLNTLGQRRLARQVRQVMAQVGLFAPLLWLYPPHSAPLLGGFGERLSVYHCIDRFSGGQTGLKRRVMESQERVLLSRADLVFTHAYGLQRLYAPLTRRPIQVVPSAADALLIQSSHQVDPEIMALPGPRLGVLATVDQRLDGALLAEIARLRPDWQIVLIGRSRPGAPQPREFHRLPNLHRLAGRPYAQVPALLNSLDVLLIPYRRSEAVEYISPIKLYEYLASGKPVVSVPLPEVKIVGDLARYAQDGPSFVAAIQDALTNDPAELTERRRRFARENSWEARLAQMWQPIQGLLDERAG